ncbi:hypothetical protein [Hyphomonas sp.]|uniref:hypothetical protein n=1 Tax=Hyphomonas sp. TaxID=87 RepID=UPI003919C693
MTRPLLVCALLASPFLLGACDRVFQRPADVPEAPVETPAETEAETGPDLPVRPETVTAGSSIDWEAARRDLAARPLEEREASFSIQSGGDAPPVPVFLPSAPVSVQGGETAIRFQPTSDGYYAFFPGDAYDIIVNGTNVVFLAPGETPQPRAETYTFAPTTTGASVTFSRYGADYLVEFECKVFTAGQPNCITEDEALAFARDLALSGTR